MNILSEKIEQNVVNKLYLAIRWILSQQVTYITFSNVIASLKVTLMIDYEYFGIISGQWYVGLDRNSIFIYLFGVISLYKFQRKCTNIILGKLDRIIKYK